MKAVDDVVWKALADPTRRTIVEVLSRDAATTGEIVDQFSDGLVRTAVMKHLDVLEAAQLIRVQRVGRTRWNHLERKHLSAVSSWLDRRVLAHDNNLRRLKQHVEEAERHAAANSQPNPLPSLKNCYEQ